MAQLGGDFIASLLSRSAQKMSAGTNSELKSGYFVESGAVEG